MKVFFSWVLIFSLICAGCTLSNTARADMADINAPPVIPPVLPPPAPPPAPPSSLDAVDTGDRADTAEGAETVDTADAADTGDAIGDVIGDVADGNTGDQAERDAAETESAGAETEALAAAQQDPAKTILEMEIKTSTLTELAAWCRSLGLSEGGSKEDLANRLRAHFELLSPEAENPENAKGKKTITIESAKSTEYFTLEVVDEEYARLRGDVVVSLKDGEAAHRIQAWEILYNRTRNIMSASGGVLYVKEEGDTKETFRGESLTVNLDTWATVFIGGVSERSVSKDETAYRFTGTVISRSDEEVTILTNAKITGSGEESFWSIDASKIWLLPGSDFAILNAVLKVGEIPVLYIPAFTFPADEIIFHPVLGTRSREGAFVQTTTYILGRPKASSVTESSLTKILGNRIDNEKIREGMFLRSTGKKSRDPNTTRLSFLLDVYTNLGVYLGTELTLPQKGIFGALDFSAGMGFTRNIYLVGSNYHTPFAKFDGSSEWNTSRIFDWEAPFRYRIETRSSLSGKYGSLSWSFPGYSDPYVKRDFMDRSEEMDWFKMLKQGAAVEDTTTATAANVLGSYEWTLNGSIRPSLPFLAPYVSSLSISSISSTVAFRTRNSTGIPSASPDPARIFFFPDKFTIASVSASIAGTPLTLGAAGSSGAGSGAGTKKEAKESAEDPLAGIGTPRSPWEKPAAEEQGQTEEGWYNLKPPDLSRRFELPAIGGPRFTIDYRFGPTAASELQFRSSQANWPEAEDVNWGEISSILTSFRSDGSAAFSLTDANTGLYTLSFRLSGNGAWQDYSLINDEAEEFNTQAKKDSAMLRVYNATFFTTSSEVITTIKPLYWDPVWGNSNFQYTLRNLIAKSVFDASSIQDPTWDIDYGAWEKEKIDAHRLGINLAASIMDKNQNASLSWELPPKDASLSLDATMRIWISETNIKERFIKPLEEEQKIEPLYFTETLRFTSKYSAQQYFVYDPEKSAFTSLTSSLTLNIFTAAFTAIRSKIYEFIPGQGWVLSTDDEEFNPRDFKLTYRQGFKKEKLSFLWWRERFSFTLNLDSSLTFDLQRYTYSEFNFSLGFTLGISKFLDLGVSFSTRNAEIFRYFQDLPFFEMGEDLPGEKNLFVDLFNSFRFDNEALRRSSGFKMKSFKLEMTHHLGDWNAVLGWTLSPYLDNSTIPYKYKFNNEISFLVKWVPIPEIKTDIYYNKEEITVR
ncbi:MAG: LPS-assembly protein LptD [Treponema sp.]|jgi:hypothetical protein|nr:LPS-assembly protein LptD [Treponema sp.]